MLHAGADQERDCRSGKSRKGSGKGKSAGAAFGWILFREPQSVDGKIRAAEAKKEKTNEKPGKRRRAEIENLSKRKRNEGRHQCKEKSQSPASSEFFGEPGHREATKNCGE